MISTVPAPVQVRQPILNYTSVITGSAAANANVVLGENVAYGLALQQQQGSSTDQEPAEPEYEEIPDPMRLDCNIAYGHFARHV